jgi:hypothetical protein
MADLSNIPKQSLYKATLKEAIDSTQTTGIIMSVNLDYTPGGETLYMTFLDPDNQEVISFTGQNANGELTGVTRGLALADGGSSSAAAHGSGIQCVLSNPYNIYEDIQTAINAKVDTSGDTMTGLLEFSGSGRVQVPVFADDTARDAAIPTPVNGLIIYHTADGEFQLYQSGTWATAASGSTQPNASETVAGKVELATQAELDAGTDVGATGASLVATPSKLASLVQGNVSLYGTTAGTGTAYTLTLSPAPTAYVEGAIYYIKAHVISGASPTLNVNSLGVKTLVKPVGENIVAGNLQADEIYAIMYDGTNFQVLNPNLTPNKGDIVIGGGSGDLITLPAGSDGQTLVFDSSEDSGVAVQNVSSDVLHYSVPNTTVDGGVSNTNILALSIAANTPVDDAGCLRVTVDVQGDGAPSTGHDGDVTLVVKADSTTIASGIIGRSGLSGSFDSPGNGELDITSIESNTELQINNFVGRYATTTSSSNFAVRTPVIPTAFDSTSAWTLNLEISNAADAGYAVTVRRIIVEYLRSS